NSKKDLSLGCRQGCKPEPLADPRKFQYLALPEFHEQVQLIEFQSARLFRQGIPTCLRQIFPHTDGTPKRQAPRLHRRVSLRLQPRGRPASCNAYLLGMAPHNLSTSPYNTRPLSSPKLELK